MTIQQLDLIVKEVVCSNKPPSKNVVTSRSPYSKNDLLNQKNTKVINHKLSDTFNTEEYTTTLRNVLGSSDDFKKLNDYTKKLIQTEIDQLSFDDYNLKTYLHRSISEGDSLFKLFPGIFKQFKEKLNILVKGHNQKNHKYKLSYKLQQYYLTVLEHLIKDQFNLDFIASMTIEDAENIFDYYLTPEIIFDSFCVILLKHARDNMFTKEENVFNEKSMVVIRHQVIYKVYSYLALIAITHSIQFMVMKSKKVIPLDSVLRSVRTYLLLNSIKLSTLPHHLLFIDGIESMFQCFVDSGIFSNITKEKRGKKEIIKYSFPTILNNQLGRFTQPPRVYKPEKVTEKNLSSFIIHSSTSSVSITGVKSVIDSLNISNGKRFSINQNFLNIIRRLEDFPSIKINRPIPSTADIKNCETQLEEYTVNINKFSSLFVDLIQKEVSKHNLNLKTPFQYRHMVDLTTTEMSVIKDKTLMTQHLQDLKITRKGGNTRLSQSQLLEGFPLYYTNKLCNTTRPFAHQYILSRHIGCLKLLRGEFSSVKITIRGLIHIFKSYYSCDISILNKFNSFLGKLKNRPNLQKLEGFFNSNSIDYSKEEAVTHFMLLSVELRQIFQTKKSKLLLQIDQVASGLVFMAILFRNEKLAIQTNTHYVEDLKSPYDLAMEKIEEFYDKNIKLKNDKVLKLCKSSRKLHKFAMMCYTYNQTTYGRTQDFVTRWINEFGLTPKTDEWESLNEISLKYPLFVNELFPGLNEQIEILNSIVVLVVNDCGNLSIRTLDGGVIEWKFYKVKKDKRKSFSPHTLVPKSYSYNTIQVDDEGAPLVDTKQFKIKFLSYLIHSFDAGIMRKIICLMYEEHNYRVDQLFDCVLLHPNQIDNFYKVLEKIYSQDIMSNYMDTHVFDILRNNISSDKFEIFDEKVKEFKKISDRCKIKKFVGNMHKMYTYEV